MKKLKQVIRKKVNLFKDQEISESACLLRNDANPTMALDQQQRILFHEMIVQNPNNHNSTQESDHHHGLDQIRNVPTTSLHSKMFFQDLTQPDCASLSLKVDITKSGKTMMGSIKQVMTRPNDRTLYAITDCGHLYEAQFSEKEAKFEIIAPFDGSTSLKAIQLACYTEAMLLIVYDSIKGQYYIYGIGNNGYFRMSHFLGSGYVCNSFELMFDPYHQLHSKPKSPPKINHVGCCYSFSICVINGHDVHITGQNWMNTSQVNLISGYHCWRNVAQSFKKKIVKMEYGDFHVVLLHEDCSVSVGGSNSSGQLANAGVEAPFTTLNLHEFAFNNIFSGSNSVLWVKNVTNTSKAIYLTGSCNEQLTSNLVLEQVKSMRKVRAIHHKHIQFTDNMSDVFDVQYTRDFMLLRHLEFPYLLFVIGSTYYGGQTYNAQCVDLRCIIPFENYSRGGISDNFYRDVVQVRIVNIGYVVYCDFTAYYNQKMVTRLFKSTDYSEPNNHLLLDISVACKH
ncbi:hypothetical protein FDP41_010414 [Naegleria fowleri]|uniref:Uncharacterized protein n=1 Tax=Naegleria fowleri TaxID=5763 RepID=A0A6A5CDH2_NAEFO|nr:uncharacterized protein FDP41_010414 [Naegleria fowleri]KAF0983349.1 hypothetical protein FDP41_010414 [Naegleria fowleri]CAG4713146.1 unnamed protein product [Naegleria fowleri]